MKKRILILCTGNSCRSQMAEGFMREHGGDNFEVFSAGIETHGVNPKAIKVMQEVGIDISHHTSDNIDQFTDQTFDYIITVCDNANENCPYFPGKANRLHQNFPDPAKATGTEEEVLDAFRHTRNLIKEFSVSFFKHY